MKEKRTKYGKVAVLMGGKSAEREISLESGSAVFNALVHQNIDACQVDADEGLMEKLIKNDFDCVFIALHGRGGEDGTVQGLLEIMDLPYTGSGVLGSALSMDKLRSKQLWNSIGLPTPEFCELEPDSNWNDITGILGLPIMVKPVREGSSFGASKVKSRSQLKSAWEYAYKYDKRVMAEKWVEGNEYTVPILNGKVLPMIKLETSREFYDYKAKYVDENTKYICPCGLNKDTENRIGQLALAAFNALDASGWGRVDLIIDEFKNPWLIEVNTIPGMTSHSLVPMSAKKAGLSFEKLVTSILDASLEKCND